MNTGNGLSILLYVYPAVYLNINNINIIPYYNFGWVSSFRNVMEFIVLCVCVCAEQEKPEMDDFERKETFILKEKWIPLQ